MSAAGFQIARVPPLLGRYLIQDDERENAPRVVVIGYDLWQHFFDGDSTVIGRRILLDGRDHAVVGVMPPSFAFPRNQWLWTALPANLSRHSRGKGPPLFVFGRLTPGVTREQAQAELTGIGGRASAAFPESNAHLRPQILPYTYPLNNTRALQLREVAGMQLVVNLLLIAVAANVGMLVYARTAMRRGEIALRTALGATRHRIVGQLFVEAMLLSLLGAALGLGVAHAALRELTAAFEPEGVRAFWADYGVEPHSIAFALVLAVLSAAIVGIVPALKSTGRRLSNSLQLLRSGASPGIGRMWTALIVAQVAVVVTVLPTALHMGYEEIRQRAVRATFPAHEFVTAKLGLAIPVQPGTDWEAYQRETAARFAIALPELEQRLEAEPAVVGATLEGSGGSFDIEIEATTGSRASGIQDVGSRGVATDYFKLLGARLLAGRDFRTSDAGGSGSDVIVNEKFVRSVLDGGPALGRRVRIVGPLENGERVVGPWREIVGVVEDLYTSALDREIARAVMYYAVAPRQLVAPTLLVRVRGGDADPFIPRLHQITASQNMDLRLGRVANLAVLPNSRYIAAVVTGLVIALITVLLLSAVGIHTLMSLTVIRRLKEIGIRIALGARANRLLASVFSRAASQVGLGGLVGSVLGGILLHFSGHAVVEAATFLGGVVVLMVLAGLLAVVGPARRGLRIQPIEALREE
jgi:putative ABC transport system permease protein